MKMQKEKINFIEKNYTWIFQEAIKYKDDYGYLAVFVNEDFTINTELTGFSQGEFDKNEFIDMPVKDNISPEQAEQLNSDVFESVYIYFCLLWMVDNTKHSYKKMTLLHKTKDYDKFESS